MPPEDHFVVGKPIPVSMSIKSCQDWAPLDDSTMENTRFMFEIATSEAWAVSGKKKGFFTPTEQGEKFKVSLLPLKTGKLPLPVVNIQIQAGEKAPIAVEVNYRNEYQSALIVPEFDRLTLSF